MSGRVAVIGLPFFGQRAAAHLREAGLDARFVARDLRSPRGVARVVTELARADLVYGIGVSAERNSPFDLLARAGKRLVMHWVGGDVLAALDARKRGRLSPRVLRRATHWTNTPWLAEELATLGIRTEELLLPMPYLLGGPEPLPETFRVLLYLPAGRRKVYDVEGTMEVVEALPEVRFSVVGGWEPPSPMANLEVKGRVDDMERVYRDHAVFLRLVRHDGMSGSVIEALSLGRHVVWSYPYPGSRQVDGPGEATEVVRQLHREHEAGRLHENSEGARFVHEHCATSELVEKVSTRLTQLMRD